MDPQSIIAEWKRRLVEMANDPPYAFRNTPQELIDRYRRGLTNFEGYSHAEVAEAEERLDVRFPAVFRTYLLEMGKHPGDLFCESHLADLVQFEAFQPTPWPSWWKRIRPSHFPRMPSCFSSTRVTRLSTSRGQEASTVRPCNGRKGSVRHDRSLRRLPTWLTRSCASWRKSSKPNERAAATI